jgi:hypothetical protein
MINSSAFIITPPDDITRESFRVVCVDLTVEQSQEISKAVTELDYEGYISIYVWRSGDPISWVLDKNQKSDLIIFNAESIHQSLVGFLAAYKKSYYFGVLKEIAEINDKNIYNSCDIKEILERKLKKDEKFYQ